MLNTKSIATCPPNPRAVAIDSCITLECFVVSARFAGLRKHRNKLRWSAGEHVVVLAVRPDGRYDAWGWTNEN